MAFGDSATLLDDFNRADEGPPPSADWAPADPFDPSRSLQVVSNRCTVTASGTGDNLWSKNEMLPDCEVYCDVPAITAGVTNERIRMYLRFSLQKEGYELRYEYYDFLSSGTWEILRSDGAVETQVGSVVTSNTIVAGDSIGFSAVGNTLKGYQKTGGSWIEVLSAIDSTYGAGFVGMGLVATTTSLDNFSAGPVSPALPNKDQLVRKQRLSSAQ